MLVRKNDLVVVIAGDDKPASWAGVRPRRVLKIDPKKNGVYVEGTNYVWRHVRRSQKHPQGGRIQKEALLHESNVMLWCDSCGRGVRITRKSEGGKRLRLCRRCGKEIPVRRG
jgi:large subunit ribosomal protein L24